MKYLNKQRLRIITVVSFYSAHQSMTVLVYNPEYHQVVYSPAEPSSPRPAHPPLLLPESGQVFAVHRRKLGVSKPTGFLDGTKHNRGHAQTDITNGKLIG